MNRSDLAIAILQFALNGVLASLSVDSNRGVEDLKTEREAAAAMLADLNPRDAIQAACAARAVTMHHAAMECFRRAALPGMPDALARRLMATGATLSRQSEQLIQAIRAYKGESRSVATIDPAALAKAHAQAQHAQANHAQANHAQARAAQAQPAAPVEPAAAGANNPIHQENPLAGWSDGAPASRPLNRAERRRAEKLAAKATRMRL
jgi:hypothetical protein